MKKKNLISKLFVTAVLSLVLTACGSNSSTDTEEKGAETQTEATEENGENVVIRVANFSYAPWNAAFDVAYQKGFFDEVFADDNVTIEIANFENGPAVNEAFLSGSVDIVNGIGDQPIVTALNVGQVDARILSTASIMPNMGIIAGKDSGISSVADLKGKKVSVSIGTSQHKALLYILQDNGLTVEDVELVNLSTSDTAIAALSKKEVDAAFLNGYPFTTAEEKGIGTEIAAADAHPMYTYIEALGSFVDEHPDLVEKFLQATKKGEEFLKENPEEGYQLISELLEIEVDQVKETTAPTDYSIQLTEEAIQNLYDTSEFLVSQDLIKKKVENETIDSHVSDIVKKSISQ